MSKVFIVSAKRTPIGSFLGSLGKIQPGELAGTLIKNILEETNVPKDVIDEVIVGNVLSAGQSQGVGRQAAIKGGLPVEVPAYSLNIICGSGMKSLMNAFTEIKHDEANLIFAGGTEVMSQAPFLTSSNARNGHKMGDISMKDHLVLDGLTDAFTGIHMGITAENIAEKYDITREEQDLFAIKSQEKAIFAIDSGKFENEIVPITIVDKKQSFIFDKDEYPNRKTSFEKLSTLRPAFKKDGSVTAGNASGVNDGASMILLASEEAIKKYNLTPLAEIISVGQGGVDPEIMGMGPIPAINNALKKSNLSLSDIELIELNEAFAAQSLAVMKELRLQHNVSQERLNEITNVNGGAIALGHPLGSSGNRIITTLVHELKKRNSNYGLASLCIGGGMGTAVIVKNIK
ncbi:acetyl-CoA C-acetyltransferase [Cetobacterium sp. 2A]|uniref:acetyl-CoA C-acetyltransferase n=1 Tax=unclassified Cetobacterium TaxID=2630983 RepID=UPI00163B6CD9|nr:acetyl-CoA C-acetyltransferase [Cetobacterium sp. 2A]MBC2857395.1 acetyl-CoA C-acetyltransferase [Cetobacterium sp. 2A]